MQKNKVVAIVGGGMAGLTAAYHALSKNLKVILFEKEDIGGKAFNGGDVYLQTFTEASKYEDDLTSKRLHDFFKKSEENKKNYLNERFSFIKTFEEIDLVNAEANIINPNLIVADNIEYHPDYIILAAGSRPNIPDINGVKQSLEDGFALLPTDLYRLKENAQKVAIIGGGSVAIEIAMILSSFKIQTHLIIKNEPLQHIDKELRDEFFKHIQNDYLHISTNNEVSMIQDNVLYHKNGFDAYDNVILATGFNFNKEVVKNLDLQLEPNGIKVNDFLQTSIPNIFAIGDINSNDKFTNVAIREALVAISNITGIRTTYSNNTFRQLAGFIEYAYYGPTEEQLQKDGNEYIKIVLDEKDIISNYENIKYVKVLIDSYTRKVMSVSVISRDALNVINSVSMALEENMDDVVNSRLSVFSEINFIANKIKMNLKRIDEKIIEQCSELFFQPKVDENKKIIGAEALSRFKINGRFTSPLPFIENFEQNGLVLQLDLLNIEKACQFLGELNDAKLIDENFQLAVNLSSLSIHTLSYEFLAGYLERYNVNPKQLIFEITERQTLENNDFVNKINKFKSYGLKISMDDFSVGNSSLSLYNEVDFDEIKLDMSLLPKDKNDTTKIMVYKTLVDLLSRKKNIISAEGIENDFHFQFAKNLNINSFQGYHFSRPLAKDDFTQLLKEHNKIISKQNKPYAR